MVDWASIHWLTTRWRLRHEHHDEDDDQRDEKGDEAEDAAYAHVSIQQQPSRGTTTQCVS
jgi:hypothetical protein